MRIPDRRSFGSRAAPRQPRSACTQCAGSRRSRPAAEDLFMTLGRSDRVVDVCLDYLRHVESPGRRIRRRRRCDRSTNGSGSRSGAVRLRNCLDLPPMTEREQRGTMDVLVKAKRQQGSPNRTGIPRCRPHGEPQPGARQQRCVVLRLHLGRRIFGSEFGDYARVPALVSSPSIWWNSAGRSLRGRRLFGTCD